MKRYPVSKVTDNGPLLQIGADSSLNNRIALGNKFNKRSRLQIGHNNETKTRDFMESRIDLSFPDGQDQSNLMRILSSDQLFKDPQQIFRSATVKLERPMECGKDGGKV